MAYATVSWSVTTGSATSLGSSSSNDRTLYIYRSNGTLLGSKKIKSSTAWNESSSYSGSFSISFDAGTYDAFTWALYIQTSSGGTQSCIWTNRDYCTNFNVSWPVYWSNATAPSSPTISPSIFEGSAILYWGESTAGINNNISSYTYKYQTSDDGGSTWSAESGGSTADLYAILDTNSWYRGRLLKFRVYANTARSDNPSSGYSSVATKNRIPNTPGTPTPDTTSYPIGSYIYISFTPNATPDPDGNLSGYDLYVYNVGAGSGQIIDIGGYTGYSLYTGSYSAGTQLTFNVRGRDSLGVAGSWSGTSSTVSIYQPNRPPNTPNAPSTDKLDYYVGDNISLSFTPNSVPDPDGNLSGYEIQIYNVTLNSSSVVNIGNNTSTSIATGSYAPNTQLRFNVRGYDSAGLRGSWSSNSSVVTIAEYVPPITTVFRINVGGSWKTATSMYINVGGSWKSITALYVNVGGTWKNISQ
jgi:hypothetical protein